MPKESSKVVTCGQVWGSSDMYGLEPARKHNKTWNSSFSTLMFQANSILLTRSIHFTLLNLSKKHSIAILIPSIFHCTTAVFSKARQISCTWKTNQALYSTFQKRIQSLFLHFPRASTQLFFLKSWLLLCHPQMLCRALDMLDCCTFILLSASELWRSFKVIGSLYVASLTSLRDLI